MANLISNDATVEDARKAKEEMYKMSLGVTPESIDVSKMSDEELDLEVGKILANKEVQDKISSIAECLKAEDTDDKLVEFGLKNDEIEFLREEYKKESELNSFSIDSLYESFEDIAKSFDEDLLSKEILKVAPTPEAEKKIDECPMESLQNQKGESLKK